MVVTLGFDPSNVGSSPTGAYHKRDHTMYKELVAKEAKKVSEDKAKEKFNEERLLWLYHDMKSKDVIYLEFELVGKKHTLYADRHISLSIPDQPRPHFLETVYTQDGSCNPRRIYKADKINALLNYLIPNYLADKLAEEIKAKRVEGQLSISNTEGQISIANSKQNSQWKTKRSFFKRKK